MSAEYKKVAIYARVSSERQDVDLSISAQVKALRNYASNNGFAVVKEYVDEAESGRSIDRPGFKQMIVAARQKPRQFEAILVWKLSRFARNREDSIIYKSLLRKQGIQVISINEPLEDTPSGRLLEGIIEVLDEFYSANLSQDVTRGMRESASRGFFSGGPVPYGYVRVKVQDGSVQRVKLEPDPTTAPVVERMFRESSSGKGMLEITQSLNADGLTTRRNKKWSKTAVHTVLKNEVYRGTLIWGERVRSHNGSTRQPAIRVENAFPAIIDDETFEKVQKKLNARAPKVTHPRVIHSEYILSGLLRCKNCGAAMIGHAVKSGQFFYYMCGNARRRGRGLCTTRLLPKEKMEQFVINQLNEHILTEENIEDLVRLTNEHMAEKCKDESGRLEIIQSEIQDVETRLDKLYDALETGKFSGGELAPRIKTLFDKKAELEIAKVEVQENLKYRTIELGSPELVREYVTSMRTLLAESSIMRRKNFLRSFLDSIEVDKEWAAFKYTWPPDDPYEETVGVLPIVQDSPPYHQSTLKTNQPTYLSLNYSVLCLAHNYGDAIL
ncbi:MAG: recombinase family protein [Dehalococcoidales bacterium]|nr:recombinase family protein [Dehalococcoidales bacterium]